MDSHRSAAIIFFALFPFLLISSSSAYINFYVGGKDGWVLDPSESYNHWAGRNRFQVNDTLVFKYKEDKDSVFQVTKEDYYSCNRRNPLKRMTSGSSVFQFPQSGPFYFISGKEGNCEKGQKLIVVVLAIRPKPIAQPPKSPSPEAQPPTTSPVSPPSPLSQPPATSPVSQSPGTTAKPPTWAPQPSASPVSPPKSAPSPSQSPKYPFPVSPTPKSATSPVPSLSPKSPSPVSPPQSAPSPVPSHSPKSPSPAPSPKSPTYPPEASPSPAPSKSPTSTPIASPPPSTTPGSDSQPTQSPDGGVSDINAPPPSKSSSWVVAPSSLLIFVVSVAVSSVIGVSA